ncbi:MAG: hypothetical protein ACRDRN_08120, partial [Sciscionella sp.]
HGHFEGQVVTDPRRLARILRRNDPQVYPSQYVLCVFDPAKALCVPQDGGRDATGPACRGASRWRAATPRSHRTTSSGLRSMAGCPPRTFRIRSYRLAGSGRSRRPW